MFSSCFTATETVGSIGDGERYGGSGGGGGGGGGGVDYPYSGGSRVWSRGVW